MTADAELHPTAVRRAPGMPSPNELLAEYCPTGGGHLDADLAWFTALSLYKLTAMCALLAKHA